MNWITRLFSRNKEDKPAPDSAHQDIWHEDRSIFAYLKASLDADGNLIDSQLYLPQLLLHINAQGWWPYGWHEVMGGVSVEPAHQAEALRLVSLLESVARGEPGAMQAFREALMARDTMADVAIHLSRAIKAMSADGRQRLLPVGRDLTYRDHHANCVKAGITLLGAAGAHAEWKDIRVLAMHEEFVTYVCYELLGFTSVPQRELIDLASRMKNRGKVVATLTLTYMPMVPAVRDWFAASAYQLEPRSAELAPVAVRFGDLEGELERGAPSPERFRTIDALLQLLLDDIAVEDDLREYGVPNAALLRLYVRRAQQQALSVHTFLVLQLIKGYVSKIQQAGDPQDTRFPLDDTLDLWNDVEAALAPYSGTVDRLVAEALGDEDPETFRVGLHAASLVGKDCCEPTLARLRAEPESQVHWALATQYVTEGRVGELLDLALAMLPGTETDGPLELEMPIPGMGGDFAPWVAVLAMLARYPGKGAHLVAYHLMSRFVHLRLGAFQVVQAWPEPFWIPEIHQVLERLRREEPYNPLREDAAGLLGKLEG